MRFLVWVFKQESKEILSICPCSIRCRMMFLPEAPKISEIKEDRFRKLKGGYSNG